MAPRLMNGEQLAAFADRREAGSDAANVQMQAQPSGTARISSSMAKALHYQRLDRAVLTVSAHAVGGRQDGDLRFSSPTCRVSR